MEKQREDAETLTHKGSIQTPEERPPVSKEGKGREGKGKKRKRQDAFPDSSKEGGCARVKEIETQESRLRPLEEGPRDIPRGFQMGILRIRGFWKMNG